jgi:hypothetical protein
LWIISYGCDVFSLGQAYNPPPPSTFIFNALTTQATHIPNLHSTLQPAFWKGKPHQPLAPPSAMPRTTKLAPAGQNHFVDFSSYRWGESHSPCFIFSRNFTDVASRTSITISPRLRPGLPSMLFWDCVPGCHRYALYCPPDKTNSATCTLKRTQCILHHRG